MKKIFVTGSRGFIGKNLLIELGRQGYLTCGFDDSYLNQGNWEEKLIELLNTLNYDAVFHVGACSDTLETDANYMMVRNYESTKIIVDWCVENNKKIIYSSSAANYGTNGRYPSNLYGWSKYVAEDYVRLNGGIALRYFNVYGPGEEEKGRMASVAYQMILKKRNNEDVFLFPKKPLRDFVYVKDVVDANIFALENYEELKGNYYEVGSGVARGFEDVLNNMGITYQYTSEESIPNGYQFYTCSDKQKWMTGWESKWDLETGIKDYKNYLVSKYESI